MGTNSDTGLTIEQRTAVSKVRRASDEYRVARDTLERQLREELQQRLNSLLAIRDNEVRIAYAMGVKKATLKRAIGSKDHLTLQNILSIGGALLPENRMISWNGVDSFTLNFVDYNGERVYGELQCVIVPDSDGKTVGFDVVSDTTNDDIGRLLDQTTSAGDMTVYGLIVDAIG